MAGPEPAPEAGADAVAPRRDEVVRILAALGERRPDQVLERIDSMELAWLLHQVEERYGVRLDPDDDALDRLTTVTGAARLLAELRIGEQPAA